MKISSICASVILYEPNMVLLRENILTYAPLIEMLYIVDNSESFLDNQISFLSSHSIKFKVLHKGTNLGIAYGLNICAKTALEDGYQWMLTMDQDSCFDSVSLNHLKEAFERNCQDNIIAIITPAHADSEGNLDDEVHVEDTPIKLCMTSGNLLNLNIWEKVGHFMDKFFIDYVDHEFCLRCRREGYKIILAANSILIHNLGDIKNFKVGKTKLTSTNHNFIRRYYMTRNRLFFIYKFFVFEPALCSKEFYNVFAEIIKCMLFENRKFKKLVSFLRGIRDFFIGKYGRYDY